MDDHLFGQREILERVIADLEEASNPRIGRVKSLEYMGVSFHVSRRFVIADLSPLSFFHLVEHIDAGPGASILRLYHRLLPLLSCRHQWTTLKRHSDKRILRMRTGSVHDGVHPHICKSCMAYAMAGTLPAVGISVT